MKKFALLILTLSLCGGLFAMDTNLDGCKQIDGSAVGDGGEPGAFFLASQKILAQASANDYIQMLNHKSPCVRVMGVLGIARQHPDKKSTTKKLLADKTELGWCPVGCVIEKKTVGDITKILLNDPAVLGHDTHPPKNGSK